MQVATAQGVSVRPPSSIQRPIEAGWLVAATLLPLMITHEDFMVGFIQTPKVFILRTAALYLLAMVAFESALARPRTPPWDERPVLQRLVQALRQA